MAGLFLCIIFCVCLGEGGIWLSLGSAVNGTGRNWCFSRMGDEDNYGFLMGWMSVA
jgi:hypothetical protein